MVVPSIPVVDLIVCSREGAGIAEAIVMLIRWSALIIAVTAAIAIASGVIVGVRKGRTGRQVAIHLGWAALFLVVLPFVAGLGITIWLAYEGWSVARATKGIDA